MFRKCAAVLAVVIYLASVGAVRAEPGAVGQWLMNEPASMFDLGMLRLWIYAKEIDVDPNYEANLEIDGVSFYKWDKNRIIIFYNVTQYNAAKFNPKVTCSTVIKTARLRGGIP